MGRKYFGSRNVKDSVYEYNLYTLEKLILKLDESRIYIDDHDSCGRDMSDYFKAINNILQELQNRNLTEATTRALIATKSETLSILDEPKESKNSLIPGLSAASQIVNNTRNSLRKRVKKVMKHIWSSQGEQMVLQLN